MGYVFAENRGVFPQELNILFEEKQIYLIAKNLPVMSEAESFALYWSDG